MAKFGNGLRDGGYDQEEAYFHKLDRELIEKARQERGARPNLTLIQGGKSGNPKVDPAVGKETAETSKMKKKAA